MVRLIESSKPLHIGTPPSFNSSMVRLMARLVSQLDAVMDQFDMHPRFSPDGKWIVFVSTRAFMYDEFPLYGFNPQPYGEVFIKKIGSNQPPLQLTHDKWEDGMPFWGYYAK